MRHLSFGNLDGLTGLAGLADRTGVNIKPTLLRVLTDLYVQKSSHTDEEERHYTELALRLIEVVDMGTCAVVAAKLSKYPNAPAAVTQRLAALMPRSKFAAEPYIPSPSIVPDVVFEDDDLFEPIPSLAPQTEPVTPASPSEPETASSDFIEQRETFFAASPEERRLILMSLEYVATAEPVPLAQGTAIVRYLEQAALAGRLQEYTTLLQQALGVSRATCSRLVTDPLGECFVVAAVALAMPRDSFRRVLSFLNPDIGDDPQRLEELTELFDSLPLPVALHLVAIWREADRAEARAGIYRGLHWPDTRIEARGHSTTQGYRSDITPPNRRRDGSNPDR